MTDIGSTSLLEWERAEIERSSLQAALSRSDPQRTATTIIARYLNPPGDTAYPLEYAFHLLGDARGQHVLDLGCGDGEFTSLIASHGASMVTALDISGDLLHAARARTTLDGYAASVKPLRASAHTLPLASSSVDVVFGMAVLHHLDLDLAAAEVHRVLKPGGRAIFMEPMRDSRTLIALRSLIPYRQPDVSPFERPLRWDEIRHVAGRFAFAESRAFNLPTTSLLRVIRAPDSLQHRSYRLDAALLRRSRLLRRFATSVVLHVRK